MLQLLIVAYVVLTALVALFQRRLLYFPTRVSREEAERAAAKEGLAPWTNRSGETIGWTLPSNGPATASLFLVHGNGGYAVDRGYIARTVHAAAPVDVFLLEYPGYGARDGTPTMSSLLDAADEGFASLDKTRPVFVVSESIGTGVAGHLAQAHPREIAGLVMFVPYDDLAALAQSKAPLLPVYLILRDRFQPAKWLQGYRGPITMVVAEADVEIPPRFGRRLYDAYPGPKALQVLANAGHNDASGQSIEWWKAIFRFWHHGAA
ncbi:MAG: alpha/beta hydrolase [Gemmatimonadaceae bacterium]